MLSYCLMVYAPRPSLKETRMSGSRKTFILLFLVTVLYTVYRYQGSEAFFLTYFRLLPANRSIGTLAVYYRWCMAFLLLGVLPACIIRFVFKEPLSWYGITINRPLVTFFVTLIGVVIVTPLVYFGARDRLLSSIYPLVHDSSLSYGRFAESALFYLLYYAGYEFSFRGLLFMGLKDDIGEWQAVGVSLAASVLLHVTQPQSEMLMAIIAGIAFPIVTRRLGSLLPAVLIHAYTGIALDYWIIIYQGGF
jgi:hypothetical protein